jgi:hypothetical protein
MTLGPESSQIRNNLALQSLTVFVGDEFLPRDSLFFRNEYEISPRIESPVLHPFLESVPLLKAFSVPHHDHTGGASQRMLVQFVPDTAL